MVQTVNVVLLIPWAKESVLEQPGLICLPMAFFRLPAKAHIVLMASAGARQKWFAGIPAPGLPVHGFSGMPTMVRNPIKFLLFVLNPVGDKYVFNAPIQGPD